jgi:hypothetical protein
MPSAMLMQVAHRQHDRLAGHPPSSFRKAMTEPVKVIAPMATPSAISISAWL